MKTKFLYFFTLSQLIFYTSCSQKTSCDNLSINFKTYDKAAIEIKSADFKIEESVNTSESSWINSASYYSCDGETGYFILVANGKEYIHSGVPYLVWGKFKTAKSFGSFYNKYLKHKYTLLLNKK